MQEISQECKQEEDFLINSAYMHILHFYLKMIFAPTNFKYTPRSRNRVLSQAAIAHEKVGIRRRSDMTENEARAVLGSTQKNQTDLQVKPFHISSLSWSMSNQGAEEFQFQFTCFNFILAVQIVIALT